MFWNEVWRGIKELSLLTIFMHSNLTRETSFIFNREQQTLFALRYFHERKIYCDFAQRICHKNFIHSCWDILYIPYSKWNFTWGWQAPVERKLHSVLCFYGNFIFFSGMKCAPPTKKKAEDSKVDFCTSGWRLCGLSQRASDRSVSQFAQRWASGTAIPKIAPSLVFAPRGSFIEAMQFTDKRVFTRGEGGGGEGNNKHMHTRAYFAPGRRGVNWIFRPASFGDFS